MIEGEIKMNKKQIAVIVPLIILLAASSILFFRTENNNISWDEVNLTKGLLEEEIKLTKEMKEQMTNLLYEDFIPEPYIEKNDMVYYGGNIYHIVFINDEITHDWIVTDLQIQQTIYKQEKEISKDSFNPNKDLIRMIVNIYNS